VTDRGRGIRGTSSGLLAEARTGLRFSAGVPRLLRRRTRLDVAPTVIRRRREERATTFLTIVRRGVYETPRSPYRALLRHSGCEYGDLEALVRRNGVEGALRALLRQGVYLTVSELKGRSRVVRGGTTVVAGSERLRNPAAAFHVPVRTGGSRGEGTSILLDLEFVTECGVNTSLGLAARGGERWLKAHWLVPGGSALVRVLEYASFGSLPVRWFSQIDPCQPGLHPRYRWSARTMRWASCLALRPLPRLRYVPLENPAPIAAWMAGVVASGETPHLYTYPSCAMRVCETAAAAGISIKGAQFTLVGEPVTVPRLDVIRGVGAEAAPRYAATDVGPLGDGCRAPAAADDVHFYDDLHALVRIGGSEGLPELPRGALLVSTLRPTAPFVLLNASLGDRATVSRRACGCPMEAFGWTTHLHTIRSFEKLTAGGMNFVDSEVITVLEETLPRRFGGAPTDYQLVEDQTAAGRPRLRLLVHPRVGSVDAARVADVFLAALGRGSGVERVMELQWRKLGLLEVERRAPRMTSAGKDLHLHTERETAPSDVADVAVGGRS
jgi:hypothetical protein